MKVLILTILAIMAILIPTVGVFAADVFWSGSAAVTVSDSVAISCTGGDGSFDAGTRIWTVDIVGGGSKILKLTANNGSTAAYTVLAMVSPSASSDGLVTATWVPASAWIAGGGSHEYILTVTSAPSAALGTYTFALQFAK